MKQPTKTPRSLKKIKELEKKQIGLNQILKPALYLFLSIAFEIVLFIVLGFKTSSGGAKILPSYIFFDIGLWLIVAAIMLCITKNWLSNIVFYLCFWVYYRFFMKEELNGKGKSSNIAKKVLNKKAKIHSIY